MLRNGRRGACGVPTSHGARGERRFCRESAPGGTKPASGETLRPQPRAQYFTARASTCSVAYAGQHAHGLCRAVLPSRPAKPSKLSAFVGWVRDGIQSIALHAAQQLAQNCPSLTLRRVCPLQGAIGALCKLLATPSHEVR